MSQLAYWGYRGGAAVARSLPEPAARLLGRIGSTGARIASPDRRRVVERNLARIHGPGLDRKARADAVRRTFDSYARYWVESFRLPTLGVDEIEAGLTYEGYEHIAACRDRGLGPIMALPHLGGWEWAAFYLTTVLGVPCSAVVERLDPPELFDWFADYRRSLGIDVIPLGSDAGRRVGQAIRDRRVVCLLSDRDVTGNGVEVEFFGERTTLPGGPALLALRSGTSLLPTAVYFRGDKRHARICPPIDAERRGGLRDDVTRVTQALAVALEALIRAAPDQWHLMQPNWPSDVVA